MRKTLAIGAGLMAAAILGSVAMAHNGGVLTAGKVKDTDILIDGKLTDAPWKAAQAAVIDPFNVPEWQTFKTHLSGGEAPKDAADAFGTFKVAYSDNYLYIAGEVADEAYFNDGKIPVYQFDGIEVWLDGLGTGGGKHVSAKDADLRIAPRVGDGQPGIAIGRMDTGKDAWKEENLKLRPGVTVSGTVTAKGYTVEAAIAWYALEPWIGKHAPEMMGIDFQINDNDTGKDEKGGGIRQTILNWTGGKDESYKNTNLFGDLLLK